MTRFLAIVVGIFTPFITNTAFSQLNVRICNYGEVPIYLAVVKNSGSPGGTDYSAGWAKLEPRKTIFKAWDTCELLDSGAIFNTYYLAFAIKDPGGRLGLVNYTPKKYSYTHHKVNRPFCVEPDPTRVYKREGKLSNLDDCREGEIKIPFIWEVKVIGASLGEEQDAYIELNPRKTDKISVYLEDERTNSGVDTPNSNSSHRAIAGDNEELKLPTFRDWANPDPWPNTPVRVTFCNRSIFKKEDFTYYLGFGQHAGKVVTQSFERLQQGKCATHVLYSRYVYFFGYGFGWGQYIGGDYGFCYGTFLKNQIVENATSKELCTGPGQYWRGFRRLETHEREKGNSFQYDFTGDDIKLITSEFFLPGPLNEKPKPLNKQDK